MKISQNKLLFSVAFLATIAVISHRLDYNRHGTNSDSTTPQALNKETAAAVNSSLFPFREQSETANSAIGTSSTELGNISSKQNYLVPVLRVIDGDTIVAEIGGQQVHVRLIGINSPELNDKRTRAACLAEKAKEEAQRILSGANVYLEKDPTQGDYDKYGRLLAYVFTADGTNFDELMIKEGFAYEYTYHLPYKYQNEFKTAQNEARAEQNGLWNLDVCVN